MNLEKKLSQWREAGLIDEVQSARIASYEQERERPIALYALGGLGALTLGIGIISIIAANWDAIGRPVKLGIDLAFGIGLAVCLFISTQRAQTWLTDVLAGVYYAFVLGSLSLLGQVYQLGSPTYQALIIWSVVTAPFMLLVRGRLLGTFWLAGLLTTHGFGFEAWFDSLTYGTSTNDSFVLNLAVTLTFASMLAYLGIARLPAFVRTRPQVSFVWTNTMWTCLLAAGLGLCFAFYEHVSSDDLITWAAGTCAVLALGLHLLLPKLYPDLGSRARFGLSLLIGATWVVLVASTTWRHDDLSALGAISQVVLLGIAAYTVLAVGRIRSFNVLTGFIALRILVMYFEVFGSMLDTGLGMISGGLLTLLLAWIWKRKSPQLAARFGALGAGTHV